MNDQTLPIADLPPALIADPAPGAGYELVTPFRWSALGTDSEVGAQLDELEEWVQWLVTRYRIDDIILPCWWQHGAVIEELSALWWAWQAMNGAEAMPTDPLQWHHSFDLCLTRLEGRWRTGCSRSSHTELAAATLLPRANQPATSA